MTGVEHEDVITVAYRNNQFRFVVQERTEDTLRGCFRWTEGEKAQFLAMLNQEDEEGKQPWYLDDDGYRLDDEKLFRMSPWSIVNGETCKKAVQRFIDCNTGQAWFCFTPWVRIGDEFNRRPSE